MYLLDLNALGDLVASSDIVLVYSRYIVIHVIHWLKTHAKVHDRKKEM